jgi:hypothetical protein
MTGEVHGFLIPGHEEEEAERGGMRSSRLQEWPPAPHLSE